MKKYLIAILLSIIFHNATAQINPEEMAENKADSTLMKPEKKVNKQTGTSKIHSWENILSELRTDDESESETWEEIFETLADIEQHPININTATREELEQIPFLTEQQIEEINAYVYQYHGMRSWGELAMIESLDPIRLQLLPYFVYLGNTEKEKGFPKLGNILKHGKHDLTLTGKVPLYDRRGDNNGYLGYKYRHSLRYTFSYGEYLKVGFIGAQDAGEPFFSNRNGMGYDHYSLYVLVRKLGRIKALAIGRYKLKLGMGLVMNNGFGFGKTATISTMNHNGNAISGYQSRSEAYYLQGAAATVALSKKFDLTAFVSYRDIDATLNKGDGSIATILKTGYHRTETEMAKKNNASQFVGGGNLQFRSNGFNIGMTALYTSLDKPIKPNTNQKYRKYYASGKEFWNMSVNYGYTASRWSLSGETATGNCHAIASINKLSYEPVHELTLTAIQRFYSYKYHALFAESFNDGGYVQNENGLYIGAEWHPRRNISVIAYSDYVYFPWLKYQVSDASRASDNYVLASYGFRKWTLSARYRIKIREKDNADKTALINDITQRARLSLAYDNERWATKTQIDFVSNKYKDSSKGYMVSENLSYNLTKGLQATAAIGYFNTDSYASRVYTYERGMLYTFYFPSFYGEGIHYSLFLRADISPTLLLIGKFSTTNYFDRDHISSGLQQIDHSSMTDLELQLRVRF